MRTDTITQEEWPQYLDDLLSSGETAEYESQVNWWHDILSESSQQDFATEGGGRWKKWMWQTYRTMQLQPAGHDTLVASGRLMNSLVRGGPENIDEVSVRDGMFGTAVPYAGLHQQGGSYILEEALYGYSYGYKAAGERHDVPARPFLYFTEGMASALAGQVADALIEHMKG